MPKFKVHLQQYVEEVAEIEVEAATAEEAAEKAEQMAHDGDIDEWHDGDDVILGAAANCGDPAWQVYDAAGELVWER